jgi:hypothetical protein
MKNRRLATAFLAVIAILLLPIVLRQSNASLSATAAAEAKRPTRHPQICHPHPEPVPVELPVICDCSEAGGVAGVRHTAANGETFWYCLVKNTLYLAEYK